MAFKAEEAGGGPPRVTVVAEGRVMLLLHAEADDDARMLAV